MKFKNIFSLIFLLALIVLFSNFFSAYLYSNPQTSQFFSTSSQATSQVTCQEGSDFLIQIAPFGCTPAVVRSDLLEENDVPVYCQLAATQINPLISVDSIDSISFSGQLPKQVSGVGFYPAKAALGIQGNLNSPALNNIGYVVINLKKQKNESAMPDYVSGNLTAKIRYNVNNAFGIGQSLFYLPELNDNDFAKTISQYSFWNGRGYLRAESIGTDSAEISLYSSEGKVSTVTLKKGETSNPIYLPGFECQAGLKFTLQSLDNSDTRAQVRINSEITNVARGEKFLDNKCQIQDLKSHGIMQQITMRCQEDTGANTFSLTMSPKIILNINGQPKSVQIGDWLYNDGNNGVYLGYVRTNENSGDSKDLYIYLISMPNKKDANLDESTISSMTSLVNSIGAKPSSTGILSKAEDALKKFSVATNYVYKLLANGEQISPLMVNDKTQTIFGTSISIIGFTEGQDADLNDKVKEQYNSAIQDYETIKKQYPTESYQDTTYGEEALYNEITLASYANQKKTAADLCLEFAQNYPHSTKDLTRYCSGYHLSNGEIQSVEVTINKQIRKISFDGIYEPTFEDYGVLITANTPKGTLPDLKLMKNRAVYLDSSSYLQLVSINDDDSANVQISVVTTSGTTTNVVKLTKNTPMDFVSGYSFTLTDVNLKKVAKVSVTSSIDDTGTSVNFNFNIGIEKRAINLPPDVIRKTIKDLNASMKKWEGISSTLGNATQALKGACLATGAVLITKNLIENAGGAGIARTAVMRGAGGWFTKCTDLVSKGTYTTVDNCLGASENAEQIDKDVTELTNLINKQNDKLKQLEEGAISSQEFLGNKVVDTNAFIGKYAPQVNSYLKNNDISSALNGASGTIDKNNLLQILTASGYNNRIYTEEQLREIELYAQVLNDPSASPGLQDMARQKLYSDFSKIQTAAGNFAQASTAASSLGINPSQIGFMEVGKNVIKKSYGGLTLAKIGQTDLGGYGGNTPVYVAQTVDGHTYIYILDNSAGTSNLPIKRENDIPQVFELSSGKIADLSSKPELTNLYFQSANGYNNEYKNPKITYYETEPYKGMPAIVPFDLEHGWYADVKATLPSLGSTQISYETNGRVSSFYLCNVGPNKLEENMGGDDICQMINTGTGQSYNTFAELSPTDASNLITKAVQAVQQASQIPESQRNGKVSIAGNKVDVGTPAVNVPQFQCQDFMSPKDCSLLFNLCDPVICPTSRCDLGGAYPVQDVVQTGIIGSIVLCFPNFVGFGGTDYFPVCLTGVKAGIDSFLSVQDSYRDCLQESLDTGKTVGICDEVYSVYICDFFWKQTLPVANLIIPKLLETIAGQNVKGGGEYLGIASAWSNVEKSINYFTNYYGANSNKAFIARTTESLGTDICKSAVSGTLPSGGDLLSSLTALDSPPQFGGTFEEISFTSVTSPPTSHYKVFYHIYAGADSGVSYQVYLKGNSESSYYKDTAQNFMIASGYVPVGGHATDTVDKLAVSGYKELCINVNGQEECGFSEVSTDFAVNYIKDSYLASEANQTGITTETECISGTASLYSLLNLNAQSAAQSIIDPAIYNEGIIRICATNSPGKGTDSNFENSNARWREVGYCDSSNIKCWIDTESVKDVIRTTTIENATLSSLSDSYSNVLSNQNGYLTTQQYDSEIKKINNEKSAANRITLINNIFEKVFWSNEKAQLLLTRGDAYSELFRIISATLPKPAPAPITETPTVPTTTTLTEEKPITTPTEKLTLGDISGLSAIRQKVLTKADELIKTCSGMAIHCWDAVYTYVYAKVGVGTTCIYSDKSGKQYTIMNDKMTSGPKTITIGVSKRGETIIFKASSCTKSSADTSTSQKLDLIQPGDLLSIAWNESWAHNVIFVRWTDRTKGLAQVFDWNGVTSSGEKFSDGKICDSSCYSSTKTFCKSFRYYITNLTDSSHPVYVIMQPVEDTSQKPACDATTCSAMTPDVDGESAISSAFTQTETPIKATIGDKIWQQAGILAGNSIDSAELVSRALVNAGISGTQVSSSVDSLVSIIGKRNDFQEVNVDTNLKRGDIVLLGKECNRYYSIGVFSTFSVSNTKIALYINLQSKVSLENLPFITVIDLDNINLYSYKAYRYVGDLSASEKVSIPSVRAKWTLVTALSKVDSLLKIPNRKNGGTYRDNQLFVDQFIFDGILTEKECKDVRTFGVLGMAQKRMDWLKTLLMSKCAGDSLCRTTYGLK